MTKQVFIFMSLLLALLGLSHVQGEAHHLRSSKQEEKEGRVELGIANGGDFAQRLETEKKKLDSIVFRQEKKREIEVTKQNRKKEEVERKTKAKVNDELIGKNLFTKSKHDTISGDLCPVEKQVECDSKGKKIFLCHHDEKTAMLETKCVKKKDVNGHLEKHPADYCGECVGFVLNDQQCPVEYQIECVPSSMSSKSKKASRGSKKVNNMLVCHHDESMKAFETLCVSTRDVKKTLEQSPDDRCGKCEDAVLRVIDALEAIDSPEAALEAIDPAEMAIVVDAVRLLLNDDVKHLVTAESVASIFFMDPTYTMRRLSGFFDQRPLGCDDATYSMITKVLVIVLEYVGVSMPEQVSQSITQELVVAASSSPMLVRLFALFESSWFVGSPAEVLVTGMLVYGQMVSFFGLKVIYNTMKEVITANGGLVSGASTLLAMIAISVTNGAPMFSEIAPLGNAIDELILEGAEWKDTCFATSCEGQGNCDDGDLCTIDRSFCDESTNWEWECSFAPKACSPGDSCDPSDGICKPDDVLVPCIAVIDEDDGFGSPNQMTMWSDFRSKYPKRPFCLLVPNPEGRVATPESFISDDLTIVHYNVTRDKGDVSKATDWVSMCGLDRYTSANVGWVGLFIDDSGSMREYEVAASRDLFYSKLEEQSIEVKKVVNRDENWILPFLTTLVPPEEEDESYQYDVVVVGGGTGGVAAAIEAARMNMSVALLEETDWLGGQMTAAGVTSMDEYYKNQESGFYAEFLAAMRVRYGTRSMRTCYWDATVVYCFEPSVAKEVLTDLVNKTAKITVYYRTQIDRVDWQRVEGRDRVVGVHANQHQVDGQLKSYVFTANVTIDATETGDVLELGPAEYRIGKSTSNAPNMNDCVQDITYTAVIKRYPDGVPPELTFKSAPPGYDDTTKEEFKKWVSNDGYTPYDGRKPISWPSFVGYRGMPDSSNAMSYTSADPEKITRTGVNYFPNDFGVMYAGNLTRESRTAVWCKAKLLTIHFLYYIQRELNHTDWAIADDEGYNNSAYNQAQNDCPEINGDLAVIESHLPVMPYVREGRRVVGVTTVTAKEIARWNETENSILEDFAMNSSKGFNDALAIGEYDIDLHGCSSSDTLEASLESETDVFVGIENFVRGPFQLPFRAFVPKLVDGLLAAEKNIAVSRLANGATRLQPITMLTGQAAGALAALSIKYKVQPRNLPPLFVQRHLLRQKNKCRLALQNFEPEGINRTHEYWEDVQLVAVFKIMVGFEDGTFDGNRNLVRDQAAVILVKTFDIPVTEGRPSSFDDVPDDHWASPFIETLVEAGVVTGCSVNPPLFCPNANLTRAELATFLVLADGTATVNEPAKYNDVPLGHWAFNFVQTATKLKWMDGCPDPLSPNNPSNDTFCPDDPVTRFQAARTIGAVLDTFANRSLGLYSQNE